jgi:hypothetical protein
MRTASPQVLGGVLDAELWAAQHHNEFASEQATLDAQLTELH